MMKSKSNMNEQKSFWFSFLLVLSLVTITISYMGAYISPGRVPFSDVGREFFPVGVPRTGTDMDSTYLKSVSDDWERRSIEFQNFRVDRYTVTAYCSCEKCCGEYAANRNLDEYGKEIVYGTSGERLRSGSSVAAPLPFGTIIKIDGNHYYVDDRTSEYIVERYNGKIIDIYFDSHEEAMQFGKQELEVRIYDQ